MKNKSALQISAKSLKQLSQSTSLYDKCSKKDHKEEQIVGLCLEEECQGSRKLCHKCVINYHIGHRVAMLNLENQSSEINKLNIHSKQVNNEVKKNIQIQLYWVLEKFTKLFKRISKTKEKYLDQYIVPMSKMIVQCFHLYSPTSAVKKIMGLDSTSKELDLIAKGIKSISDQNFKDLSFFQESVQTMVSRYSEELEKCQKIMIDQLVALEVSIKKWSIFQNNNWKTNIEDLKRQKKKQAEIIQIRKVQNEWIKKINASEKIVQQYEIYIQYAKQRQWIPVVEYIKKGTSLDKITQLDLRGSNQNKFPTIGINITKIKNLEIYQSLKILNLCSNQIKKIQNLNNLFNLQNLFLGENRIAKIQNLEELKKLVKLQLSANKIRRIQNLQQLPHLKKLYLQNNPIELININRVELLALRRKKVDTNMTVQLLRLFDIIFQ